MKKKYWLTQIWSVRGWLIYIICNADRPHMQECGIQIFCKKSCADHTFCDKLVHLDDPDHLQNSIFCSILQQAHLAKTICVASPSAAWPGVWKYRIEKERGWRCTTSTSTTSGCYTSTSANINGLTFTSSQLIAMDGATQSEIVHLCSSGR